MNEDEEAGVDEHGRGRHERQERRHDDDEVAHSLLPDAERIETMSRPELAELRDLLADWEGPAVETFRARVRERLAETEGDT